MGCCRSIHDDSTQPIESERKFLFTLYSTSMSCQEQVRFHKRFSQGISITDMKKEIVFQSKPSQEVEDDPIFQLESHNDSFLGTQQQNQTNSSKGILKSQRSINRPQKKVTFDQLSNFHTADDSKIKQKKKLRKSIYRI